MGALSSAYQQKPRGGYGGPQPQPMPGGSANQPSSSGEYIPTKPPPGNFPWLPPGTPSLNNGGSSASAASVYEANLRSNYDALMAANASQFAGFRNSASQAQLGLQYQGALSTNSRNAAVNQFNQGIGELNLNRLGNAYQQQATGRDSQYYSNVYNNTYRQYLTDYDWTNQQEGFAGNDYNANSGFLNAQQTAAGQRNDLAIQGFGAQREDAGMAQMGREQAIREALATGGGGFTQGLRSDRQLSDYERTATDRDIGLAASLQATNYGEQTAGFGRDRALLDNGWNRDRAGFANARTNMNLDLERSNLNYEQQQGQIADRNAELALQAARFNLDEDAMRQNVENQLQRLGLENQMTSGQLLDAIRNGNAQQQQLAQQIFQQAASMTQR
jgi:hypothetical protein